MTRGRTRQRDNSASGARVRDRFDGTENLKPNRAGGEPPHLLALRDGDYEAEGGVSGGEAADFVVG
jgi:hypothetical protein